MRNTIFVQNYEIETIIGIYDFEKEQKQRLIISAEVELDTNITFQQEDIQTTLDYDNIINIIDKSCDAKAKELLEVLAENIASEILGFEYAHSAKITIQKPDIYKHKNIESVGVSITRTK